MGANYEEQDYEHDLKDDNSVDDYGPDQFEVVDY